MKKELTKKQTYETKAIDPERPIGAYTKQTAGLGTWLPMLGVAVLVAVMVTLLLPMRSDIGAGTAIGNSHIDSHIKLGDSMKVADMHGNSIPMNSISKSGEIVVYDYFDRGFTTKLECTINLLPVYCNGSPFTISGLPPGSYSLKIGAFGDPSVKPISFSWTIA